MKFFKVGSMKFVGALSLLILGISSVRLVASDLDEAMGQLRRDLVVERLKKAYTPVSIKLDGAWTVSFPDGTETWTWANGQWKCKDSRVDCAKWQPQAFKWFAQGKTWVNSGAPLQKLGFDFEGTSRAVRKIVVNGSEEEANAEEAAVSFEGKRNALELWQWNLPFAKDAKVEVGLSLRDGLIERLRLDDQLEVLDWSVRAGSKAMALDKILVEREGQSIVLARK